MKKTIGAFLAFIIFSMFTFAHTANAQERRPLGFNPDLTHDTHRFNVYPQNASKLGRATGTVLQKTYGMKYTGISLDGDAVFMKTVKRSSDARWIRVVIISSDGQMNSRGLVTFTARGYLIYKKFGQPAVSSTQFDVDDFDSIWVVIWRTYQSF